jgi:hypothetical protein
VILDARFLSEPLLEFGSGQKVEHPQDGLFLYGPVQSQGKPQLIQVGILGTLEGINLARNWLRELNDFIPAKDPTKLHTSHWPGFQAAFGVALAADPLVVIHISGTDISNAIGKANRVDAVRSTARVFEDAILEQFRAQFPPSEAQLLHTDAVIQVIRETTIDPSVDTDPSHRSLLQEGTRTAPTMATNML